MTNVEGKGRRWFLRLAALAAAGVVVPACGPAVSPTPGPRPDGSANPETTLQKQPENKTLKREGIDVPSCLVRLGLKLLAPNFHWTKPLPAKVPAELLAAQLGKINDDVSEFKVNDDPEKKKISDWRASVTQATDKINATFIKLLGLSAENKKHLLNVNLYRQRPAQPNDPDILNKFQHDPGHNGPKQFEDTIEFERLATWVNTEWEITHDEESTYVIAKSRNSGSFVNLEFPNDYLLQNLINPGYVEDDAALKRTLTKGNQIVSQDEKTTLKDITNVTIGQAVKAVFMFETKDLIFQKEFKRVLGRWVQALTLEQSKVALLGVLQDSTSIVTSIRTNASGDLESSGGWWTISNHNDPQWLPNIPFELLKTGVFFIQPQTPRTPTPATK